MPRFWVALLLGCASAPTATQQSDAGIDAPPAIPVGQPPRKSKPANVVGGFSMTMPKVTLMPGEEKSYCFASPMNMTGPSFMVGGGVLRVGKGLHHGNVTTRKQRTTTPGGPIVACGPDKTGALGGEGQDVVDGGSVLFGSTTQVSGEEWQSFPEGMAFRVKPGFEIAARMHYLNATKEPLEIQPVYEWFTVDESKVKTELSPFFWVYKDFSIAPHSKLTVKASCTLPSPMKIVTLMPHMHKLATGFTAGYVGGPLDGKNFLESKGYDPDRGLIMQWDPAVDTAQGEGISFSCSWENTLDKTVVEGIGDNEMCMAFGYGYPAGKVYTLVGNSGGSSICPAIAPPP
jgi:hypothetical protein